MFKALRKTKTLYDPGLSRLSEPILSISSREDEIQTSVAQVGAFDPVGVGYGEIESTRTIRSKDLAQGFLDVIENTDVGIVRAHSVLHSSRMGRAIGIYLRTGGASTSYWQRARTYAGVPEVIRDKNDIGN